MDNLEELHKSLLKILDDFDIFCRENNIEYSLAYGTLLGAVRHKGFIPWDDDLDVMMTRENYNKFLSLFKNNEKYTLQKEQIDYPLYFSKLRKNRTAFIENIKYRKPYRNIHQGVFIDIFPADKVSKNSVSRLLQIFFSNILISQSLFLRGYQTKNILKHLFMFASSLFVPCRKAMFRFTEKFNFDSDYDYYCCFFGETKKIFINRDWMNFLERREFNGGGYTCMTNPEKYLELAYGDWKQLPSEEERIAKLHARIFDLHKSYEEFLK
ncbi:LicD family protein [uncultured Treponema sp.]|uniref:LicD family protein n=1 Tax=uncultured Treponema sp. TaxID=162155 RepID=UPI000E7EE82C|nr:LicD family protein [uncultured Treponema sp.]HAZ96285.1 hypothetical protein [Treponema sp.]